MQKETNLHSTAHGVGGGGRVGGGRREVGGGGGVVGSVREVGEMGE